MADMVAICIEEQAEPVAWVPVGTPAREYVDCVERLQAEVISAYAACDPALADDEVVRRLIGLDPPRRRPPYRQPAPKRWPARMPPLVWHTDDDQCSAGCCDHGPCSDGEHQEPAAYYEDGVLDWSAHSYCQPHEDGDLYEIEWESA